VQSLSLFSWVLFSQQPSLGILVLKLLSSTGNKICKFETHKQHTI